MLHPRILIRASLGLLIALLAFFPAHAQTPDDAIIARVNGEALLLSQLKEAALDQDVPPSALLLSGMNSPEYRKALTQIVDELLLVQQARTEGIKASDMVIARDVEQMIGELRTQIGSQQGLEDFLEARHLTLATLRNMMTERERKRSAATQVVAKRVVVDDVNVEQYTRERSAKKLGLEEINLAQLLVPCTPAERAGAHGDQLRATAMKAAREAGTLKLNELPGYLSRSRALAPAGTTTQILGWLDPLSLRPELRATASKMKAGEVSAPVEAADGYHVLIVLGRHSTRDMAFVAEFEKVRQRLVEQLRSTASIQLYDLSGRQIRLDLAPTSSTLSE